VYDEQNASEAARADGCAPELSRARDLFATGDLLARAFVADPVLCQAEPDPARRARWMSLLYRALGRYAAAAGGVELVGGRAAALWLQNQTQPPFWQGLLYGSLRVMLALGWRATWRCLRHEAWCAARVRKLGFERYGYVWLLGVDPVAQRAGNGRRALGAALEAMRARDHQICLLKTESPSNVAYYRGLGFELIDECLVPPTQIRYWLFRRDLRVAPDPPVSARA
jgi:ribosomal protein S18 acetylase RimI-like enzyme